MENEYFDQVLAAEEEIVPSAGFAHVVMEAVRRDASGLVPIPFPWKHALPGLMLVALVVAALVSIPFPIRSARGLPSPTQITAMLAPILETMRRFGVNWLLEVLLLSWTCVKFSMSLASWRS